MKFSFDINQGEIMISASDSDCVVRIARTPVQLPALSHHVIALMKTTGSGRRYGLLRLSFRLSSADAASQPTCGEILKGNRGLAVTSRFPDEAKLYPAVPRGASITPH